MRFRRGLAGVVAATLFVPLAGPGRAQTPPCTWSIGIMGALSGDLARYGRPMANGARLAVDLANRERDLPCALAVHAEDTQGDPSRAPRKAQELVDDTGVVACICGFFSGESLASGTVFDEGGLLMASTGSNRILDEQGYDTWFRAVAADPAQGAGAARYIVDALEARSVTVVHDNQDYSRALARDVARGVGDRLDGTFVINPEESDHSAVVVRIKQIRPDVVFYGGFTPEAGPLLRQLREAGVRAAFVTGDGAKDRQLRRYLRPQGPRARMRAACPCSDPAEIETASTFVAEYQTTYGRAPRRHAADAFDVANVAIDALRGLSGTESVEQARAHVLSHFDAAENVEGTVKDYTWDERGELVADDGDVFIWKWLDRARRFEYVARVSELTGSG
ncbi:MAG TPA: branched-chain amino acid ABC transporter substrate-binding protein [Actinomycetota bacterium]|nr:branched-chain amino acid ABC transporter substrate-binding protein [Actinomycetota bacterium]